MVVTALTLGGVLLLAMAVTAGYAARVLPAGARVPLNAGVPEHSVWLSKRAGLAAWFGAGVAAFAVFALLTTSGLAANWAQSVRVVLLPCVMAVVLAAEAGAVIVAQRTVAGVTGTEAPQAPQAPAAVPEPVLEAVLEDLASEGDGASSPASGLPKRTPGTSGHIKSHITKRVQDFSRFGNNRGPDHDTVTSDLQRDELRWPGVVVCSGRLLLGQVFATVLGRSRSGKHDRSENARGRSIKWHHLAMTGLLLAGAAGCFSYIFVPNGVVAPVADRLSPSTFNAVALGSLLGQGQAASYPALPAPVTIATAKDPAVKRSARPAHAPRSTSSGSPPTVLSDAAGLGFYDGQSSPSGMETAVNWLGSSSTVKYAEDFIDATDFSHISNPWQLSNWQGSPFTMMWAVPMVPCGAPATQCATNVSDFDEVANGGADGYYKTLAQNLVSAGFGSSFVRIGWEFNGNWMGWSICNQDGSGLTSWASDFVPAFQNIVTSMRSVSGANFKFVWNPLDSSNVSCPGASLEKFYPGDNYVDAVALDVYDGIGSSTSDADRWTDMLNGVNGSGYTSVTPDSINGQGFQGYGLNWLAAFGKAHGKEISLPEWGLDSSDTNSGGGDDPYFMTQMADWIKANATGPAIYWNYSGGTLPLDIPNYTSGGTPNATAAFKTAFNAGI